jgi:membrane-bound lytic murein transglycosylase
MSTKITSGILNRSTQVIIFRIHKAEEMNREKEISIVKLEEIVKNKEYLLSQLEKEFQILKEKYEVDTDKLEREKDSAVEQYKLEIKKMNDDNKQTIEKLTSVYEEKLKVKHDDISKLFYCNYRKNQSGNKERNTEQEEK